MSELWSAQQHGWLEALGHTVYAQGELPPEPLTVPAPKAVSKPSTAAEARPVRAAHAPRPAPGPATRPEPHRPLPSRLPDRLHFALIRAAGCNPNAPGVAEVIASWPTAERLRGDPAAKRALWPRLRALRRPTPS